VHVDARGKVGWGLFVDSHVSSHSRTHGTPADWFDCLDSDDLPCLSEKEIAQNLRAIIQESQTLSSHSVASNAIGLLTTENRKIWSDLRTKLRTSNANNRECLDVIDTALFVVCLDDEPLDAYRNIHHGMDGANLLTNDQAEKRRAEERERSDLGKLCENFLCGTYAMENGVQVGTCTNRWSVRFVVDLASRARSDTR
jgi:carnitine O-acetyltransferase